MSEKGAAAMTTVEGTVDVKQELTADSVLKVRISLFRHFPA